VSIMSKCPANPSGGGHAIRMGPEGVAEYIRKELCKGRRYEDVLKEVDDCQYCIYCGEAIW